MGGLVVGRVVGWWDGWFGVGWREGGRKMTYASDNEPSLIRAAERAFIRLVRVYYKYCSAEERRKVEEQKQAKSLVKQ